MTRTLDTAQDRLDFWRKKRAQMEKRRDRAQKRWFAASTAENTAKYATAKRELARADAEVRKAEERARRSTHSQRDSGAVGPMTYDNLEIDIGTDTLCVDWGPTEDGDLAGAYSAAVYRKDAPSSAPRIFVHADDVEEVIRRGIEAARALSSTIDWGAEWGQLSKAVQDEVDHCTGAAAFAERRGKDDVAAVYRQQAERLRRIHAGQPPADLEKDLRLSVSVAGRMKA